MIRFGAKPCVHCTQYVCKGVCEPPTVGPPAAWIRVVVLVFFSSEEIYINGAKHTQNLPLREFSPLFLKDEGGRNRTPFHESLIFASIVFLSDFNVLFFTERRNQSAGVAEKNNHKESTVKQLETGRPYVRPVLNSSANVPQLASTTEARKQLKNVTDSLAQLANPTKDARQLQNTTEALAKLDNATEAVEQLSTAIEDERQLHNATESVAQLSITTEAMQQLKNATEAVEQLEITTEAMKQLQNATEAVEQLAIAIEDESQLQTASEAVGQLENNLEAATQIENSSVTLAELENSSASAAPVAAYTSTGVGQAQASALTDIHPEGVSTAPAFGVDQKVSSQPEAGSDRLSSSSLRSTTDMPSLTLVPHPDRSDPANVSAHLAPGKQIRNEEQRSAFSCAGYRRTDYSKQFIAVPDFLDENPCPTFLNRPKSQLLF